jgi:inhibitor of the pro-sigma K processing machinery
MKFFFDLRVHTNLGTSTERGGEFMTLIFLGLFILLIGLVVRSALGKPNLFLKLTIHMLGGIVGLWLFDFLLSILGYAIPINFFTITLVGLLGFPGGFALAVLQFLGI